MKILVVDDEKLAMENNVCLLKQVEPEAEVASFTEPDDAVSYLSQNQVDIAFLDIEMGECSGMKLAEKCKRHCPNVNIIFVTGYSDYMMDAFKLHASGYLMKPIRVADLRAEIDNLLYPLSRNAKRIRAQTFGNFEVFVDEKPIRFRHSKTKELLAYLVDRHGAETSTGELCSVLWEAKPDNLSIRSYLRTLIVDLKQGLAAVQAESLLLKKRNSFALDCERLDCDLYNLLRRDSEAVNAYTGEYMTQYSWAELRLGELERNK